MCFKNVFPYPSCSAPNQSQNQQPAQQPPLVSSFEPYYTSPMEPPNVLDELLNSGYCRQPSSVPPNTLSYVDRGFDSPSGDCSLGSNSPMSDVFACNSSSSPISPFSGRKPVFSGQTRPPEYMYQSYSPPYHHRYYNPLQGLDMADGNQFSPGSDLETKYGIAPATSLISNSNSSLQSQTLCKVCGDVASGNHFGVQSCEACKSFFRRSVRAGARYACRANRMCTIEKHTRNRCQYCRLQKCIQRGMRREAVQEERTPPVSKLQRATTPTQLGYHQQSATNAYISPTVSTPPLASNSYTNAAYEQGPSSPIVPNFMVQNHRLFGSLPNLKVGMEQERMSPYSNFFPTGLDTFTTTNSRPNTPGNLGGAELPHPHMTSNTTNVQSSNVSPSILVEADMQTDLPPEPVTNAEGGIKLEHIFEGARQSLLRIIEWGKRIPAFMSLSLDDQVKLLKSSWCEHVLLKLSTRMNAKSNTLLLSSGVTCHKDQIEDPEIRKVVERISNDVAYWLDMLHIDRVEMACLKGIILFNPDARGLSTASRKKVELFQEQILQALETRCRTVYPVTPLRYSKLLLRLAPLKAAALESTQHMEVQRTLGNTKLDNIFNELLDLD